MSDNHTTPWTSQLSNLELLSPALVQFSSQRLPNWDAKSAYAVDTALAMSLCTYLEDLQIKGASKRLAPNPTWERIRPSLLFAFCLGYISRDVKSANILSVANFKYLSKQLESVFPELGTLLIDPQEDEQTINWDFSYFLARSVRLIDNAVELSAMRYRKGTEFDRMITLTVVLRGAAAGAAHLGKDFSGAYRGDILLPLRTVASAESVSENPEIPESSRPQHPKSPSKSAPTITESNFNTSQYDNWVTACKQMGALQRLPERLIVDLIPPVELADSAIHNTDEWQDSLEKAFPGRRDWLIEEGVTDGDMKYFWNLPAWVQNFIEALTERNFQLEYRAHLDQGNDTSAAKFSAFGFIPTYSLFPQGELDNPFRPIPLELFERVRHHFAIVDSAKYQDELIANDCFIANDYIRRKIRDGTL